MRCVVRVIGRSDKTSDVNCGRTCSNNFKRHTYSMCADNPLFHGDEIFK